MALRFIAISVVSTLLSFVGVQFGSELSFNKLISSGLIGKSLIHLENESASIELVLGSYTSIMLLANFMINAFILLILCLKVNLWSEQSNYVITIK